MHAGDVMEQVVADLVAAIEAGAGEWTMPWRQMGATGWPANAVTHNRYGGGNALVLNFVAARQGYPSSQWATYKQWATIGAQVRRGERGTRGIYWHVTDAGTVTETDADTGETVTLQSDSRPRWARAFTVFNIAQVDGAEQVAQPEPDPLDRDAHAEAFFAAVPAEIRWGSGNPAYLTGADAVRMPRFDAFHTAGDAYATLAHDPLTAPGRP